MSKAERKIKRLEGWVRSRTLFLESEQIKLRVKRESRPDRIEELDLILKKAVKRVESINEKLFRLRNKPEIEEEAILKRITLAEKQICDYESQLEVAQTQLIEEKEQLNLENENVR